MDLARFAFVRLTPEFDGPLLPSLRFEREPLEIAEVTPASRGNAEGSTFVLLAAVVPLERKPPVSAGEIVVPAPERRVAERAIEAYADLLTLKSRRRHSLASPRQTVGLRANSESDRRWLSQFSAIHGADVMTAYTGTAPEISDDVLMQLDDRLDGLSLLVESIGAATSTGALLDHFRLFERAFALPARKTLSVLADFLAPRFQYTPEELTAWLSLRDRSAHADLRADFVVSADLRSIGSRVEQAAYDVLLNKAEWRSPTSARVERWTPQAWTEASDGRLVSEPGVRLRTQLILLDEWGAYPHSNVVIESATGWWIPAPTNKTAATPLRVIPVTEFPPGVS